MRSNERTNTIHSFFYTRSSEYSVEGRFLIGRITSIINIVSVYLISKFAVRYSDDVFKKKQFNDITMTFLSTTGAFALVYVAARLAAFIYRLACPVRVDVKKFGQWALVTGSTDGIGRAYAIELAKRGQLTLLETSIHPHRF
jgi:hypothetical protein